MTKTILVVEDDKAVARMLSDVLEAEGFAVLAERDGEWGLRAFKDKPVDLVIVDVLIPKIKGFDLIQRLRELDKGKNIPIVVISGVYRAAMHRERIINRFGVVEYLDKPVDIDGLIDVLHDVFSSAYPVPKAEPIEAPPPPSPSSPPMPASSMQTTLDVVGKKPSAPRPTSIVPPRPLSVPERGDLEEIPFARLLGALFSSRSSGVLLLRKGSVKKIVYMRQGIPVFVKSNLLNECLGRVMVAERMITQEECDRSLEKKKTSPKKQGEILVEMGSISPHNLEFALELQMQAKLFDVFSWLEGKYQFVPKDDFTGPTVALSLAPTAMIYEGASRTMSADRIETDLSRIESLTVAPTKDPTFRYQALELDPRAARLIDRIDGKRTVRALLEDVDFDEDDARLLLYAMSCTSLLEVIGAPRAPSVVSKPPVPAEDAASLPPTTVPPETVMLGESDVVALSTAEINAIAEISKLPAEKKSAVEAALFEDAATEDGANRLDASSFEPPAPPPAPAPAAIAPPPPVAAPIAPSSIAPSTIAPSSIAPSSIASPSVAQSPLAPSSPAQVPSLLSQSLPPASSFAPSPAPPPAHRIDASPQPAGPAVPALSDELRRQVRARLEAEAAKLAAERASQRPATTNVGSAPRKVPSKPKEPISKITAPRLDLERENARTKKELTEILERLDKQTCYEVLGVSRRASLEDIRAAHQRVSRDHHPDRLVPSTTSRENRALAESVYVRVTRAYETLADPDLRRAYDRTLNGSLPDDRIAPILLAERAFTRGRQAFERGDLDAAYDAFKEAADHHPNESVYWAHLAYTAFTRSPKDDHVREQALAQLDRAAELGPRSEDVFVFRGTIHQKTGGRPEAIRDFEAAVRINPDCLPALKALRTLEPPAQKKTGLLSMFERN